jgi:hypothetical protein
MKDIVQTIAGQMSLAFLYARVEEANTILDNGTFPCILMIQPVNGTLLLAGNAIQDTPALDIWFMDLVDMQDLSETNATKLNACIVRAKEFLSRLAEYPSVENRSVTSATYEIIPENIFDANVIGIVLTVNPSYINANRCY